MDKTELVEISFRYEQKPHPPFPEYLCNAPMHLGQMAKIAIRVSKPVKPPELPLTV